MIRLTVLILLTIKIASGARILGVVPSPSYSHQIIFQPIFEELAKRGHDLVVLTTDPVNNPKLPNIKEIDWSYTHKIKKEAVKGFVQLKDNPFKMVSAAIKMINSITAYQLEHPDVVNLINNKTEHFDLVMIEFVVPEMFAFKHRFNCPFIGMTTTDATMQGQLAVGNAVHQVLYPEMFIPYSENLTFFQRLYSFLITHYFITYYSNALKPDNNKHIQKYFGDGYPDVNKLVNSIDMLFTNTNPVFSTVRPVTPATINIHGGIHIKPPQPLPKDLQEYLDSAKSGVIYFSLGSNIKSIDIPIEVRNTILKVFSELPYKVLWKFESDDMTNKPDNVKILKWVPQQDVLRHPNIKVFITQGGLQSLEEALFIHVPLIVMPFYGDQDSNAERIASRGLGLTINQKTMSAEEFKTAVLEVITNIKYKNTIKELAIRVKDEPMNALEKAVWWTEYVIRNKGAQHLKGPGQNLPMYQYYYLDIFAFVITVLITIISILYILVKKITLCLYKLICKKKKKTIKLKSG